MIPDSFYESIGLTERQQTALKKALAKDQQYKDVLRRAGVADSVIDKIAAQTDTSGIDEISEAALIEEIKEEWKEFI